MKLLTRGRLFASVYFGLPSVCSSRAYDRFIYSLGPSDIVLDCGANVGRFTDLFSWRGAVVHAFEPNPAAYTILKKRFLKNENVYCYNAAVGKTAGRLPLYLHSNYAQDPVKWSTGSSLQSDKSNVDVSTSVEVEVIDLSDFINSIDQRVRLVKMDIEGEEVNILPALFESRALEKIDMLFVEVHDDKNIHLRQDTEKVRSMIEKYEIDNISLDWH